MPLLRMTLTWIVGLACWVVLLAGHLPGGRRPPDGWLQRAIRRWGRLSLRILGVDLLVEGESTLEGREGRVWVLNHQSLLELFWGASLCPPGVVMLVKREAMWIPGLNLVFWAIRSIFVDRRAPAARASLDGVAARIRDERLTLVLAPEGTRTPDGEIGPFKKGAFHVAIQAGVPVCPVVVSGAWELCPKTRWLPRPGPIRVRYLAPIPSAGHTVDTLLDATRAAMLDAFNELRSRAAPGPPATA